MPHFEKGIEVKDSFERFTETAKASADSFQELSNSLQSFRKRLLEVRQFYGHFEKGRWVSEK